MCYAGDHGVCVYVGGENGRGRMHCMKVGVGVHRRLCRMGEQYLCIVARCILWSGVCNRVLFHLEILQTPASPTAGLSK